MESADGRFQVVFNGEIYNYLELKNELVGLGCSFRSESDTEVILAGYAEWGAGVLDRLRGMFAFALFDARDGSVLLARDPLGIKPLYVGRDGQDLVFGSELASIRPILATQQFDAEGIASFLLWGSIPSPLTLYAGIRSLPPGHLLHWFPDGREETRQYWALESELGQSQAMDADEAAARARAALVDSVSHHAIADVPVGAFLSGGVDSASLVGLLGEVTSSPVRSINLSFDEASLDESALATRAAETYGADHMTVPIRVDDIRDRLPDAMAALDQPSIDGINTYFVSEACVKAGLKVAVSGVGGDELFGGYLSFQRIPRIQRVRSLLDAFPGGARASSAMEPLLGHLRRGRRMPKMLRALVYGGGPAGAYFVDRGLFSPPEVRRLLRPEFADAVDCVRPIDSLRSRLDLDGIPPEERISAMEIRQYLQAQLLRDTDAMSMRHSLEVRTPLVDIGLLRDLMQIPAAHRLSGPAKRLLREAPNPSVPERLWNRRKQGFTLPFEQWIRDGAIDSSKIGSDVLAPHAVESVRSEVMAGRTHWSRLWALVVLDQFVH